MNTVLIQLTAIFECWANLARQEYQNHDRIAPMRERSKPDREVWVRLCLKGSEATADCGLEFFRDRIYAVDSRHEGNSLLTIKGWFANTAVYESCRGQLFRQHLSINARSLFDVNDWGLVLIYSEALEIAGRLRSVEHVWEKEITEALASTQKKTA